MFGLSRPTFYQAEAAFEQDGLAGLLPQPRGPKSAHKLTPEVMKRDRGSSPRAASPIQARALAQLVQERWVSRCTHAASSARSRAKKNADPSGARCRAARRTQLSGLRARCATRCCGQARARRTGRHRLPRHVARPEGAAQTPPADTVVTGERRALAVPTGRTIRSSCACWPTWCCSPSRRMNHVY